MNNEKINKNEPSIDFAKFILGSRGTSEFSVYETGWERCPSSCYFGPCVRDYYILHYVVSGCGTLWVNGRKYKVTKNQFFLVPPRLTTSYCSDKDDPWHYYWLGFGGIEAKKILELCNFTDNCYVLPFDNYDEVCELLNKITILPEKNISYEYMILGCSYQLLGLLIQSQIEHIQTNNIEEYIRTAVNYFKNNYIKNIKVFQAADLIGLERSYFTRIFIKVMKQTPQSYLTNLRLNNALLLLRETQMTLKNIAIECGFNDFSHFYKTFCKKLYYTPTDYRKKFQLGNFKDK